MPFKTKYTDDEIAELLTRNYQKLEEVLINHYKCTCRICGEIHEIHRTRIIAYSTQSTPLCKCLRKAGFVPLLLNDSGRLLTIKCVICHLEKTHRFTDGIETLICATPGCTEERNEKLTKQRMYQELRQKRWNQFDDWLVSANAPKNSNNRRYVQKQLMERIKRRKKHNSPIPLDQEEGVLKHFDNKCFFCSHEIKSIEKANFLQLGLEIVPECGFCQKQRKDSQKVRKKNG